MKVQAFLVKAFTKDKTQGNPAGVILNADNLSDKQMIAIAKKLGFSESAFVQKSDLADYNVRFFTPTQEVDLCGHATIATFHTLVKNNEIMFDCSEPVQKTQETKAGILPVTCFPDGLIMMDLNEPQFFEPEPDRKVVAKLLSLHEDDLLDHPIQCVSTGTPKLIIPIKSLDLLLSIQPDLEGISKYCKGGVARGFYPYTPDAQDESSDFHARQFNPLAGINEDPITGVAAGALACYIKNNGISDKTSFVIEQGFVMNKSGKIIVDISEGIKVGGYAVEFGEEEIEI